MAHANPIQVGGVYYTDNECKGKITYGPLWEWDKENESIK